MIQTVVFTNALAFLLISMGIADFTYWTIGFFTLSTAVFSLAVLASNVPIIKGVAMLALGATMIAYSVSLNIPEPYTLMMFLFMTIPNFMAIGLGFIELGKG